MFPNLQAVHADFVPREGEGFSAAQADGRVPISPAVFVADHLRPAAKAAELEIPDGYRFGLHNLRHSLSSWLVNKGKAEPKTVQSLLNVA